MFLCLRTREIFLVDKYARMPYIQYNDGLEGNDDSSNTEQNETSRSKFKINKNKNLDLCQKRIKYFNAKLSENN